MVKVLVPSGALGLNYDQEALQRGIAAGPDIIAIDGGSTDSGPSYLGRGVSKYARSSTRIEWAGLMQARVEAGVPLVIGTAGTCGTDSAVDWMLDITREIAAEQGNPVRIAVLTVSDTRNLAEDRSGTVLVERLESALPPLERLAESQNTNFVKEKEA